VSRFRHISLKLAGLRLDCRHCGCPSPVPYYRKLRAPFEVVFPRDHHPVTNEQIWVQKGIEVPCEICKQNIILELPSNSKRTRIQLFGDEAGRPYFNNQLFLYLLVGADEKFLKVLPKGISHLSRVYVPRFLMILGGGT